MKTTKIPPFFLLLGILFCCTPIFGQNKFTLEGDFSSQYQVDSWNSNTHEFSNSILSFLQSENGHIWVGTFDGFYKFDGISFTRIDAEKKHEVAFSNYTFWSILEDSKHNLWLGTNGSGIIVYDFQEKKYVQIESEAIRNAIVINLFQDSKGTIWAGTRTHLLKIQNLKAEIVQVGDFSKLSVHTIMEDEKGLLWLGTRGNGLVVIKKSGEIVKQYTTENGLASNLIYSLLIDTDNTFWVATAKGLFILKEDKFIPQPLTAIRNNPFPIVTTIYQDEKEKVTWVGTDEGLVYLKDSKQFFISNLPDNKINAIQQDTEGNIWIGTYHAGLARLKKTKFFSYTTKSGLNNDIINCVVEDNKNNIWIGTNDGLSIWNDNKVTNFTLKDGLVGKRVRDIFPSQDKIWIATYGGVSYFKNGKIHDFEANSVLQDKRIRAIYYDEQKGNLWIGSNRGLHCYTAEKEMLIYGDKELGSASIISINPTSQGLAIGTDGGGLSFYTENGFKRLRTNEGLGGNVVFNAYEDGQNNIWVSTNAGLSLIQGEKITVFRMFDGLSSNTTFQTLEDEKGMLWFTCNKNVFTIPKKELLEFAKTKEGKLKPTIYTTNDGLAGSITGASKAVKTKDGWMAFPTLQGVSFINPSYIELDHHEPKVYIEKISLDGMVVEHIKDGQHIEILPEAHHIKISYTALSYRTPQKTVFKYRLFPFETEWIETQVRELNYTSLPSGKYTFELMAANGDGIWTKEAARITLNQKGYFYTNPSFWIISSIILGIISIFVYRYRLISYQKSQEKLEHLVKERTVEIQNLGKEIESEARETNISYTKVSDSIRYAKRIQDAILHDNELFTRYFSDFFIFWKAKDVVSGDFYWSAKEDSKIIIAVGDCTGHGVPAAFMTILGTSTLDKIVRKDNVLDASLILQKLDEEIYTALHHKNITNQSDLHEGMDISICVFDYNTGEFDFAGAKSRALFFQNDKMTVLDGDKSSIGSKRRYPICFTTQKFSFQTGDKLYLFSDGIPDQFGGKNNRKYLTSRLKKFLSNTQNLTIKKQEQALIDELAKWQGNTAQIDDIILVGIEL
jgi:ligand-binding sensor domain-containing protein/serine phosphatase RsbU (regulator of sigma subunit)